DLIERIIRKPDEKPNGDWFRMHGIVVVLTWCKYEYTVQYVRKKPEVTVISHGSPYVTAYIGQQFAPFGTSIPAVPHISTTTAIKRSRHCSNRRNESAGLHDQGNKVNIAVFSLDRCAKGHSNIRIHGIRLAARIGLREDQEPLELRRMRADIYNPVLTLTVQVEMTQCQVSHRVVPSARLHVPGYNHGQPAVPMATEVRHSSVRARSVLESMRQKILLISVPTKTSAGIQHTLAINLDISWGDRYFVFSVYFGRFRKTSNAVDRLQAKVANLR
ncbi:hypothetical protein CLF_112137, partial [Clonorchis sinensis]